ncbi:thiosulfate oxidation carrier complex protein SoxZ [Inmirania thermothiophila]|uniref:Sulfur compound chelating protein SoxZ n=1 Tax=Inmirania thermothiophila TaxID=1750597 RepID=A0A3N1XX42_9GAMM|nr:thiosulfate oxidation carrier complex protein SoxZ [Inmirania thermothiophila]ROR29782.1 sulfur compound chelating protein SoxZ [Inmirania thermothiophila]
MAGMRIRARTEDGVTTVKALIKHPMETGLRKDPKTGAKIPAHHITELVCEHEGRTVLTCHWGTAVSKDPFLAFAFKGGKKGETVRIRWVDNKGQSEEATAQIG